MRVVFLVTGLFDLCGLEFFLFFFFKQKTADDRRISDWSSDVCSSDLAIDQKIDIQDVAAVVQAAHHLDVAFPDGRVLLDGRDVGARIREERIGDLASRIAGLLPVRHALLDRQRRFCRPPGLVADGRDMGTVVFPDASLKIFLVADVDSRARRRCNQLKGKGFSANLAALLKDMRARDERDRTRAASPLVPAADAHTIESSDLSIVDTVKAVL